LCLTLSEKLFFLAKLTVTNMKSFIFSVCFFISVGLFAQIKFEKGYLIDAQGTKKDVFIKNLDWENNPEVIEYRVGEVGGVQTLTATDIKEFGIGNTKKFISTFVKVDSSSDVLSKMWISRVAPYWLSRQIFAQVLVDGDMSLYSYKTGKYHRFYYKLKTDSITPLVYKRYLATSGKIGYNKQYIMQLEKLLNCSDLNKKIIATYSAQSLSNLIIRYNQCANSTTTNYRLEKKIQFQFKLTSGVSYSGYKAYIDGGFLSKGAEFEKKITPRFGLEVEMLLPYWNNRFSIVFDPNYRMYKDAMTSGQDTYSVNYTSIELPVGVRTHFFLKGTNQIFADAFFIPDNHLGSSPINIDGNLFNEKSAPNYGIAIGYTSNKFSVSIRAHSLRNIGSEYVALNNSFKSLSLIASYRIFTTK
jgi:hypothetical protein